MCFATTYAHIDIYIHWQANIHEYNSDDNYDNHDGNDDNSNIDNNNGDKNNNDDDGGDDGDDLLKKGYNVYIFYADIYSTSIEWKPSLWSDDITKGWRHFAASLGVFN